MTNFTVVIPARFNSTRLPGKPLINIAGVPMIKRVYAQCCKAVDSSKVYVATDDYRIFDFCNSENIQAIMTSESCLTGTDRVAEAALSLSGEMFINIQGDEPVFNHEDINKLIETISKSSFDVYAGYAPILSDEEFRSISVPKMVFNQDKKLLYTSRSPIPGSKTGFLNLAIDRYAHMLFLERH